ncbi:MAG TPA: alpha/beta fold hydrolase, partial [Actinomycetales bacterium]|nr:alpha/beta fold hydrolase [Actinomycetales bacterium]
MSGTTGKHGAHSRGAPHWLIPALALALAVLVVVVGAATLLRDRPSRPSGTPSQLPSLSSPTPAATDPAASPAFARFYGQKPAWESCYSGAQCTRVTVPLDWQDPEGKTLQLAVVRLPATKRGDRLGAVVLNPGGPGASGVQYVGEYGQYVTTKQLRSRYDVVGFDPRGVGASDPVDCLPDQQLDQYLAEDADPEQPGGLAVMRSEAKTFVNGCERLSGGLLPYIGTSSAARDMDVLRAVLGEQRLNYLGKSYGTLLGATYAGLFPNRVGRMVLDGALDPASSNADVVVGQAGGMEMALRAFVKACLNDAKQCALNGDVEHAVGQVRDLLAKVEKAPLSTDDPSRPLTAPLAVTGIVNFLYSQASWPDLSEALSAALAGDGNALLASADSYADRRPDGKYASNLLEAFTAINCLDYPMDDSAAAMEQVARRAEQASPTFGAYLAYGEVTCGQWPVRPERTPAPIRAEG